METGIGKLQLFLVKAGIGHRLLGHSLLSKLKLTFLFPNVERCVCCYYHHHLVSYKHFLNQSKKCNDIILYFYIMTIMMMMKRIPSIVCNAPIAWKVTWHIFSLNSPKTLSTNYYVSFIDRQLRLKVKLVGINI